MVAEIAYRQYFAVLIITLFSAIILSTDFYQEKGTILHGKAAAVNTVVFLTVSPYQPDVGDTIVYTMNIENVNDLYGYQFDIAYNSADLEFEGAAKEAFLSQGVEDTFFSPPNTTEDGKLKNIVETRLGSISGVNGAGMLAKITFTILNENAEHIVINNLKLSDSKANEISASIVNKSSGSLTTELTEPKNTTYNISTVTFNYTVGGNTSISRCIRSLDNINKTLTSCANETYDESKLGEGSHAVILWVNDTNNNVRVSGVSFTFRHDLLLNNALNRTGTLPSYNASENMNISGVFRWNNLTTIQGGSNRVAIKWKDSTNNTLREINFTPTLNGNYWDSFTLNNSLNAGVWWVETIGWTTQNSTSVRFFVNNTPINITKSLGSYSFSPISRVNTLAVSGSDLFNLTIQNSNGDIQNNFSFVLEGDLANSTNFTVTLTPSLLNVSGGRSNITTINISVASTVQNGIYRGDITINRINDRQTKSFKINLTITTFPTGLVSISPSNWTLGANNDANTTNTFNISNTGAASLVKCNTSISGALSPYFTAYGNNFSVEVNESVLQHASLAGVPAGIYLETLTTMCAANINNDASSASATVSATIVQAPAPVGNGDGSGGGGGSGGGSGGGGYVIISNKTVDVQNKSEVRPENPEQITPAEPQHGSSTPLENASQPYTEHPADEEIPSWVWAIVAIIAIAFATGFILYHKLNAR